MPDGSRTVPAGAKTIRRYVQLLTGDGDASLCWRFLPEKGNTEAAVLAAEKAGCEKLREQGDADWRKFSFKRNFDGTLAEVIDEMREHQRNGWGIFTVVNEGGRNGASITKIRALHIDLDNIEWENVEWHAEPDFIVARDATHAHAYWRVTDCPVQEFTEAQLRLIRFYKSDPAVHDLPRVLRVPGTKHQKDARHPHVLRLIEKREEWEILAGRPLAELITGLPDLDPETIKEHAPGAAVGPPVTEKLLREVLAPIKSDEMRRVRWKDVVAMIRATNLVGDESAERRRAIAHEWMRAGGHPIGGYDDQEGIDQVFDGMPPKEDGLGFGSLVKLARDNGFTGSVFNQANPHDVFSGINKEGLGRADTKSAPSFMMSVRDVLKMPDPLPLVEGFIMEHENTCFVGPPKAGKTFLNLDIGLSIASDLPVFGKLKVRRHGPVIYLSGEGHAGMKRRLMAWFQHRGVGPDPALEREGKDPMARLDAIPFYYKADVPVVTNKTDSDGNSLNLVECQRFIDGIRGQLQTEGKSGLPVLVVVDTMARSLGGEDENANAAASLYLQITESLRANLDCTVLTIAHCRKDATGDDIDIRGSGGFTGGFDAIWTVEQNKQNGVTKMTAKWLKESANLGPFAFRMRKIVVPGMELGETAVLDLVNPHEFDRKPADAAERQGKRRWMQDKLTEYGAVNLANALTTAMLAERITLGEMPPRPRGDDITDADKAEWDRQKNERYQQTVNNLNYGSPASGMDRHRKKALYSGFYEFTVKAANDKAQKWWFLPTVSTDDI